MDRRDVGQDETATVNQIAAAKIEMPATFAQTVAAREKPSGDCQLPLLEISSLATIGVATA